MQIDRDKRRSVLLEIHSQILQLDIKLEAEEIVSEYVKLLVKKRELQELLNQIQ